MLMANPATALSETRRVLRPGGRLSLAVWSAPEQNPFFSVIAALLVQRGHLPPPDTTQPGPFMLAREENTVPLIKSAGFRDVRTEVVSGQFEIADIDEYMSVVADTAGPIALVLRTLRDAEHGMIKAQAEAALGRFKGTDGYQIPCAALCAVAS
jgi:hypothetical protein